MSGSTQTCTFEVEELLKDFGAALAARRLQETPPCGAGFNSRPIVAALLAFLVFAPGCAAAAVFLMKTDGDLPAFVVPDSIGPLIAKSDRLPLSDWGTEAASGAEARFIARAVLADPTFLSPLMIRGSLEDAFAPLSEVIAAPEAAETAVAAPAPAPAPKKSQPRRETRRAVKPPKLVAEAVQPEPAPPSVLEKLFNLRFL